MLDVKVTIENDKVVVDRLAMLAQLIPDAVSRGLRRAAVGIFDSAFGFLSGPSSGFTYVPRDSAKGGAASGWRKRYDNAGSWPIPIRFGHLRRSLFWMPPNSSKQGEAGTFSTGPGEFVISDAAAYADPVFRGRGSSRSYGPRNPLRAGLEKFNAGGGIKKAVEEEIRKELNR